MQNTETIITEEQRDYITTLVGNALTALDDPDGLDLGNHDPTAYAIANLCEALRTLEPDTYSESA